MYTRENSGNVKNLHILILGFAIPMRIPIRTLPEVSPAESRDHHYLIHPGENVDGNSAEPTRHNTFESGGSTNNMRQPVTEHQSNQAQTIVDTVN